MEKFFFKKEKNFSNRNGIENRDEDGDEREGIMDHYTIDNKSSKLFTGNYI